jgi:C2 domain
MGACLSRNDPEQQEVHMNKLNSKNDKKFIYYPLLDLSLDSIKNNTDTDSLIGILEIFIKKKDYFMSMAALNKINYESDPEINIEVQKGINLEPFLSCINQGYPYVKVSLEPKGPWLQTYESDPYLPYWFRFIQFKQIINYNEVLFIVYSKNVFGPDSFLGKISIKISDLINQQVKDDWFALEPRLGSNPCLKVRVQYLHNKKELLESIISYCNDRIDIISGKLQVLEDGFCLN